MIGFLLYLKFDMDFLREALLHAEAEISLPPVAAVSGSSDM